MDRFLYSYVNSTDSKPKGAIFLEGLLVKRVGPTALEMTSANNAQRRELHCKTSDETAAWLDALTRAARSAKLEENVPLALRFHGERLRLKLLPYSQSYKSFV